MENDKKMNMTTRYRKPQNEDDPRRKLTLEKQEVAQRTYDRTPEETCNETHDHGLQVFRWVQANRVIGASI